MKDSLKSAYEIFKELNYILSKNDKRRTIGILFLIIISSFLELLGVTAILPFMQAILSPGQLMENSFVRLVMDIFKIRSSKGVLLLVGFGLIILYIFKNSFMLFSNYMQCIFNTNMQKELSVKMLRSYMSRPYIYFVGINSSEILRCCTSDVASVYLMISYLMSVVAEILNIILIGIYMLVTEPFIALGALLLMGIVMIGIIFILKPAMKRCGQKNMVVSTQMNKTIFQTISGIKEIFVTQRKVEFMREYEETAETYRRVQKTYSFLNTCPDRIVEGICISGIIGIICIRLCFGMDMITFIPKLGAFAMAAFKLFPSIGKISNRISSMVYYRPQVHNCYQNAIEVNAHQEELAEYESSYNGFREMDKITFHKELSINHIQWSYPQQENPILSDVSFKISKGESIALIGESGSGKTTLSDCILGLLKPQQGMIELDGIDIYTIPKEWAQIVGYVPQNAFLIDDTVRNNVAFGLEADDDKVWAALERARLKNFIAGLPEGLDTIVGERGIKFSGGQKQRVVIARALYTQPEILVLDEATAALDNGTENAVMESIEALYGQVTMIIVAHRLSTIQKCDKIYEVVDGKVVRKLREEVLNNKQKR